MDLNFTAEYETFRDDVRAFLVKHKNTPRKRVMPEFEVSSA